MPLVRDPEPRQFCWFHLSSQNSLPSLRQIITNWCVIGTAEGECYFSEQGLPRCGLSSSGKMKFSAINLGESARISFQLYLPVTPSHLGDRLIPDICLVALYLSNLLHIHYLPPASQTPPESWPGRCYYPCLSNKKTEVSKGYMTHSGSRSHLVKELGL